MKFYETSIKMPRSRFDEVNTLLAIEEFNNDDDNSMEELYALGGKPDDNQLLYSVQFEDGTKLTVRLVSGQHNYYTSPEMLHPTKGYIDLDDACGFELSDTECYATGRTEYTVHIEVTD